MADKKLVEVNCAAKDLFDSSLKTGLEKSMTAFVTNAVEKKSRGKLTTKGKGKDGYALNVTLAPLKADSKDKPTKLAGKVSVVAMPLGSSSKAFNGSANGAVNGFGSNAKGAAEDLTIGILEDLVPKVIETMLRL